MPGPCLRSGPRGWRGRTAARRPPCPIARHGRFGPSSCSWSDVTNMLPRKPGSVRRETLLSLYLLTPRLMTLDVTASRCVSSGTRRHIADHRLRGALVRQEFEPGCGRRPGSTNIGWQCLDCTVQTRTGFAVTFFPRNAIVLETNEFSRFGDTSSAGCWHLGRMSAGRSKKWRTDFDHSWKWPATLVLHLAIVPQVKRFPPQLCRVRKRAGSHFLEFHRTTAKQLGAGTHPFTPSPPDPENSREVPDSAR